MKNKSTITISAPIPIDPCLSLDDTLALVTEHFEQRLRCIHYFRDNQGVTHYYMEPVEA